MESINLGILGVADVVTRSIIEPAKSLNDLKIYAIASRQKDKASVFANKHNIPFSFEGYDTLLQCKEIDAVYIPLINSLHAEWAVKAIKAGKHVLVEKPICMNTADVEKIKNALGVSKVQVVEGMMIQYHPWQVKIKEIINSKTYGSLKNIHTTANYILHEENSFRLDSKRGGSAFWEEGGIWCQLTQVCLGLKPISFEGFSDFSGPTGVDTTFKASMIYPGDVTSTLICSYELPYEANITFEFEDATIKLKNYWKSTFGFNKLKFEITHKNSQQIEYIDFPPSYYFYDQLKFFTEIVNGAKENNQLHNSFERIEMMERIYNKVRGNSLWK